MDALHEKFVELNESLTSLIGGGASGLNSAAVRKLANSLSHAFNVEEDASSISL
jgi:hypothetical protein